MIKVDQLSNLPYLVGTIALKNLKMKYKNSLLGFVWSMLHPLAYLAIFIVIFKNVFVSIERYPLYALIGLVFWTFFNNTIIQTMGSMIQNASVIKTIAIPKLLFPLSAMLTELMSLLLTIIPFFIVMYFFGMRFTPETILLIPALLLFAAFSFGLGLLLCTLNIFFRDISFLWNTLSPAIFYLTPIAFASQLIPPQFMFTLKVNPLYHFIEMMRTILYSNEVPALKQWAVTSGLALGTVAVALLLYNKLKRNFISFY